MLGGKGRGPLTTPIDYDALLISDAVARQVMPAGLRRQAADLSRFVEAPLATNPVPAIAATPPQTIPYGGSPPVLRQDLPALTPPGVTIGR